MLPPLAVVMGRAYKRARVVCTPWHARTVRYVFAQATELAVPDAACANARRVGDLAVTLSGAGAPGSAAAFEVVAADARGAFLVTPRPVAAPDIDGARHAERADASGRAAGLAELAARCPTIWVVESDDAPEWLALAFCAALAFTALGPVLPPEEGTLYGVNSARARAERLRGSP
jgi:hypothetical protein